MPASPATASLAAGGDHPCQVEGPVAFDGIRAPDSLGRFLHRRDPIFLDGRAAPGARRPALYSIAVFDLEDGPVVVTLPRAGRRQLTLTAMDEGHALQAVCHGPGRHILSRDRLGTRRVMAVVCLMLDPEGQHELTLAQALQDAIRVEQRVRQREPQASAFQAPVAL
jgi:hypothetical protein